jgi:hypothetical protein
MNSAFRSGLLVAVVAMILLAALKGCLSPIPTDPAPRPTPTTEVITATEGITGTVAPTLTGTLTGTQGSTGTVELTSTVAPTAGGGLTGTVAPTTTDFVTRPAGALTDTAEIPFTGTPEIVITTTITGSNGFSPSVPPGLDATSTLTPTIPTTSTNGG